MLGLLLMLASDEGGPVNVSIARAFAGGAVIEGDASPEFTVSSDGTATDFSGEITVIAAPLGSAGNVSVSLKLLRQTGPGAWVQVGATVGCVWSEYYDSETGNYVTEQGTGYIAISETLAAGDYTYKFTASKTGARAGNLAGNATATP